ncbi:hypothetical protein MKX03_031738 [Papaver bracteatum]|nr:hypothetical protein MKX03_031738 [Papaver bracteatum]
METLLSFNSSSHPLLLQSSKNKAFYPFRPSSSLSSLLPSSKKPEFVSFPQKRGYRNVDVSHSNSLKLKAAIGSVSCKSSASDQSSFDPPQSEDNAGSTKIPSQETLKSKTVRVEFQLIRECLFRQEFLVVGDDPILGAWDPSKAIPLKWSQGHIWTAEIDVPIKRRIEFLFILKDHQSGEFVWQPGPHRVLKTRKRKTNRMVVLESWDFEGLQRTSEEEPLANSNPLEEDVTGNWNTDDTMPNSIYVHCSSNIYVLLLFGIFSSIEDCQSEISIEVPVLGWSGIFCHWR